MDEKNLYDAAIIGGGPAGLTAALYLARAKYRVVVIEKNQLGGQIAISHEVVNYPGVEKTSGKALADAMYRQAKSFGAAFLSAEAQSLEITKDIKTIHTDTGKIHCFGVLLATGAYPRTVGFAGEEKYRGRGVSYCATCDGEFFTGKDIFVIGGGFAAAEESVFLARYGRHVTILIREEDFTCAPSVAESARNHPKITVIPETEVEEVNGENGLTYIRYRKNTTGEIIEFRAEKGESFGVFVFAGYIPAADLVKSIVPLDEQGYVITDSQKKTSVDGVYAAGDLCAKSLRQVVTAVGDGALAAVELERYCARLRAKTGYKPEMPDEERKNHGLTDTNEPFVPDTEQEIFAGDMDIPGDMQQLDSIFAAMERSLVLELTLDNSPLSEKLEQYMTTLANRTEKLRIQKSAKNGSPCVRVCLKDGSYTGLAFHGAPGGHEWESFVLGLYNAAGPGQNMDPEYRKKIEAIDRPVEVKILVTLSCAFCPDVVTAAQRIAAESPYVTAEVYDLQQYPALQEKYRVMSVPCMVVNDSDVTFGRQSFQQILDLIRLA